LDRLQYGRPAVRKAFRTRLLEMNPYYWLAARQRSRPLYVMFFLIATGCVWLWLYWKYGREMLDPAVYIVTAMSLHIVLKIWIASEACRPIANDRRSGALELLLSTPLPVSEILRGERMALMRQFGMATVIILAVDLAMFFAADMSHPQSAWRDWVILWGGGLLMLFADICTLPWVSMWLALVSNKPSKASGGAIFRILVLPWLFFFALLTVSAFVEFGFNQPENLAMLAMIGIGLANSFAFLVWSRTRLTRDLRSVATQRFESRRKRWWWSGADASPPIPVTAEAANMTGT
jgi:hypothetical protein